MITTTHSIDGYRVTEVLGIVTGHAIVGTNFMRDLFARIRDVIGGRAVGYEKALRAAEFSALQEMNANASQVHANAVIGVSLAHESVNVRLRGSMLMVAVTGTAVRIEPLELTNASVSSAGRGTHW